MTAGVSWPSAMGCVDVWSKLAFIDICCVDVRSKLAVLMGYDDVRSKLAVLMGYDDVRSKLALVMVGH